MMGGTSMGGLDAQVVDEVQQLLASAWKSTPAERRSCERGRLLCRATLRLFDGGSKQMKYAGNGCIEREHRIDFGNFWRD
jgi:hypothetical protein